jgi:hypothetical protein
MADGRFPHTVPLSLEAEGEGVRERLSAIDRNVIGAASP